MLVVVLFFGFCFCGFFSLGFVEEKPTICWDLTLCWLLCLLSMRVFSLSPVPAFLYSDNHCLNSRASRRECVLVIQPLQITVRLKLPVCVIFQENARRVTRWAHALLGVIPRDGGEITA